MVCKTINFVSFCYHGGLSNLLRSASPKSGEGVGTALAAHALLGFGNGINLQVLLLIALREPSHVGSTGHDINGLLQPDEDGLLHIGDTVLLADIPNERSGLLVAEHGEAGPKVVLNLVVEVAVHEIAKVGAVGKIDRGGDLTDVKGTGEGTAAIAEAVHVITGMVGNDGDEAMEVGKEFGKDKVLDGRGVHAVHVEVLTNEEEGKGEEDEVDNEVGAGNDGEEFPERVEGRSLGEKSLDGDGILGMDVGRNLLALTAEAGQLELLVGVGGVVEPLPGHHVEEDDGILG